MRYAKNGALAVALLVIPAVSLAQTSDREPTDRRATAHSAVQKTGLVTLWGTAALGAIIAVNAPPLGDEQCAACGDMGKGAYDALVLTHFGLAAATLGLYVSSEILAETMTTNPYYTGDAQRQGGMQALRWVNVGLFATQPILGVLAAHPGLVGVPPEHRQLFSRVVRTLHLAVGAGTAASYTAVAVMQW
jgi:hypothetical protein